MSAPGLPLLEPFPAAACTDTARLLFVNAEARHIDLWEEVDSRVSYVRDLADSLATIMGEGPTGLGPAFASVANHLLKEASVFHRLAYAAALRERGEP